MTTAKIREVISVYRELFEKMGIEKADYPPDEIIDPDSTRPLAHCHGMLDKMEVFLDEGRIEKCFRWLGFLQGFLWREGLYTLDDLKNHSRPD
jgi:hypothetical protein